MDFSAVEVNIGWRGRGLQRDRGTIDTVSVHVLCTVTQCTTPPQIIPPLYPLAYLAGK